MRFHIGLSALLLVFGALEIHLTPAPADSTPAGCGPTKGKLSLHLYVPPEHEG